MYTAEYIKTTTQNLRQKIAGERRLYAEWNRFLQDYPEAWEVVRRVFIIRAKYYRGEILRTKRHIYLYAMGFDIVPYHSPDMILQFIKTDLEQLGAAIQQLERVGMQPGIIQEMATDEVKILLRTLNDSTESLERQIYGGE